MSMYDNEIDLRPYILAFRQRWWLVAIVTIAFASAAFAYSYFQERDYEAIATILLTRSRASLSLANQFPTITEPADSSSRMEAMISIADNEGMVVQTLDEIHQVHPDNGIDLEELKKSVKITSSGDTIRIAATMNDPEYAAIIANTWARNAVKAINYAYTEEQLPSEIQISLEPARDEYELAQSNLESFLRENQVDELRKQIDETSALLDELVKDRTWKIAYNVRRKQKMDQVINQAEILNDLFNSGETSVAAGLGDVLSVIRLRANAFSEIQIENDASNIVGWDSNLGGSNQGTIILSSGQPELVFDVQLAELIENLESGRDYQRDLRQIIEHAENEKKNAETDLLELAQQSLDVDEDELFNATSSRLRNLQSELEAQEADLMNFTDRRDLSLEIYQALVRKEAEVRNNLQTSSTVNLAGPAVPSIEPISRGLLRNTIIGAAIGFIISMLWVIGSVWLKSIEEPIESDQNL